MEQASLSYFLHRMNDIRCMYLDVIESGSTAMLSAVIEQQQLKNLPTISDRDIQIMQWVVKKMPVRNSKVATREFLSFLIQLKGAVETKELKWLDDHNRLLLQAWESLWLMAFKNEGSLNAAKERIVSEFEWLIESEESKNIINTSYQTAKQKWAHQNLPG